MKKVEFGPEASKLTGSGDHDGSKAELMVKQNGPEASQPIHQKIDKMAELLIGEAKSRADGRLPPDPPQEIDQARGLSVRWLRQPAYTLIVVGFRGPFDPKLEDCLWIVIYFASKPTDDGPENPVDTRTEQDQKRALRQLRKAFRTKTFPRDMEAFEFSDGTKFKAGADTGIHRHKMLVIDRNTRKQVVKEMLAVCFFQVGIDDGTVSELIGTDIQDNDQRDEFILKIADFVDPSLPMSYSAYRKTIRRELLRKAILQARETANGNPEEMANRTRGQRFGGSSRQRVESAFAPQIVGCNDDSMSLPEVAAELGIPLSTLYRMVATGKVKTLQSPDGVIQVEFSEYARLRTEVNEDKIWQACFEFRAKTTTYSAAKRWVQRRRKSGANGMTVFKSMQESEGMND